MSTIGNRSAKDLPSQRNKPVPFGVYWIQQVPITRIRQCLPSISCISSCTTDVVETICEAYENYAVAAHSSCETYEKLRANAIYLLMCAVDARVNLD